MSTLYYLNYTDQDGNTDQWYVPTFNFETADDITYSYCSNRTLGIFTSGTQFLKRVYEAGTDEDLIGLEYLKLYSSTLGKTFTYYDDEIPAGSFRILSGDLVAATCFSRYKYANLTEHAQTAADALPNWHSPDDLTSETRWTFENGAYCTFTISSGLLTSINFYNSSDEVIFTYNTRYTASTIKDFYFGYPFIYNTAAGEFYAVKLSSSVYRLFGIIAGDIGTKSSAGAFRFGTSASYCLTAYSTIGLYFEDTVYNTGGVYDSGGTSSGSKTNEETGTESGIGGGGTYDNTSDAIEAPSVPAVSAAVTNFVTIFSPTVGQLQNLSTFMWDNSLFDLDTWKKIFDNPMDAIIGLQIVPVAVTTSGTSDVTVGNITTTVEMNVAATQYVAVDCGTVTVSEYWGSYLDYDPYTKIELYLPYCGIHPIKTDDVMNKTIGVVYHIDILSGACCVYVSCGDSVLYSFVGQCALSIPLSGSSMQQAVNGVISIAGAGLSMIATGGASAPYSAPAMAATAINTLKPTVAKSGSMGGAGGLMSIQTPYLIITRPRQCVAESQAGYTGYPCHATYTLSSLSGFTQVEEINLAGVPCTSSEREEILELLKSGVIC